jgi:hypothetical protein
MTTDERVDALFLEHFGVKGMKWGVRRGDRISGTPTEAMARQVVTKNKASKTKIQTAGGENHPATQDAVNAALSKQKLKKSGVHALSNQELLDLQTRMNLEQNVTRLVGGGKGQGFVAKEIASAKRDPIKAATGAAALGGMALKNKRVRRAVATGATTAALRFS